MIVRMGALLGDTNADGTVNSGDAIETRKRAPDCQPMPETFGAIAIPDGTVTAGDTIIVRAASGSALSALAEIAANSQ